VGCRILYILTDDVLAEHGQNWRIAEELAPTPYAMDIEIPSDVGAKWIWNVSRPVSPHAFSQRPDGMLVQHAINCLMAPLGLTDESGNPITSQLHRDGYLGPKTLALIQSYQRNLKSRGKFMIADGSVDPAPPSGWTKDGNPQYTIIYLNREYRDIYKVMMEEKDFPELLQANLRMNKSI
jgi:hypothetical protein